MKLISWLLRHPMFWVAIAIASTVIADLIVIVEVFCAIVTNGPFSFWMFLPLGINLALAPVFGSLHLAAARKFRSAHR